MLSVYKIKTFPPAPNSRGGEADFEGTYRKGELRGIIRIDQDAIPVAPFALQMP